MTKNILNGTFWTAFAVQKQLAKFWMTFVVKYAVQNTAQNVSFAINLTAYLLVSTYVVCERLSVMHKQVCVHIPQTVKFVSKFSRKPLSGISDQRAPPPQMKHFRFEMTKVYSGIPPSPQWKTSDLRWPKFTPEWPPPKWKTSDLRWPKFTPEYPPPAPVGSESGRSYVETKSVSPVDTISLLSVLNGNKNHCRFRMFPK